MARAAGLAGHGAADGPEGDLSPALAALLRAGGARSVCITGGDVTMSAPIATLCRSPERILASGGAAKVAALRCAMALLRPTVFITDEATASAQLA